MTASNMSQLNMMLMQKLETAMSAASKEVLQDMKDEVQSFYDSGYPKMYVRTYALKRTPKTTAITAQGKSASFDAYLDQTHRYTSGKHPTMHDVLRLANNGETNSSVGKLWPTAGKGGFWDRAETKVKKTFERTLKQYFK